MNQTMWLDPDSDPNFFPPIEYALLDPPGLIAAGGDLRPERLIAAYRHGIFPWYSPNQPILWWSPDPREVLVPKEFKRSRSLSKRERNASFELRFDTAFTAVINACAEPRDRLGGGTWITNDMRDAYVELNKQGLAHSVETWQEGLLVGGLYGVQLGAVFFGESMFSRVDDASKVAFAALVQRCIEQQIELIDCQMSSAHLTSLGSQAMPRLKFIAHLTQFAAAEVPNRW